MPCIFLYPYPVWVLDLAPYVLILLVNNDISSDFVNLVYICEHVFLYTQF